jgi:hypothetical protein
MEVSALADQSFKVIDFRFSHVHKKGFYRILVGKSNIKYLAFSALSRSWVDDQRGERLEFKTVPSGDWNIGELEFNTNTAKFTMLKTQTQSLPSAKKWHPLGFDVLSLPDAQADDTIQMSNRLLTTSCIYPINGELVVRHVDWDPDDIFEISNDTEIYFLINKLNERIAPNFLGHVTENGTRVIGYIVERISGRPATIDDLHPCRTALARLHGLGIYYGFRDPSDFIIANDGTVFLHEFEGSYKTKDQKLLNDEMSCLEMLLEW